MTQNNKESPFIDEITVFFFSFTTKLESRNLQCMQNVKYSDARWKQIGLAS